MISTFLTFEKNGKEAIEFYASIFNDLKINSIMTAPDSEYLVFASFTIGSANYMAMDGGEYFKFSDAVSLYVDCKDQAEVDYYWSKLGKDGKPGQCGWLKDKYGLSWQIIPKTLGTLMSNPDQIKVARVRNAMLKMNKIIVRDLEEAYKG